MKKIVFLVTLVLFTACKGSSNKDLKGEIKLGTIENRGNEKIKIYYMTIEAENGDKTKVKIEFLIDELLINKFKLNESKIYQMTSNAALYADWNANFKPTYKHDITASLLYDAETSRIHALMRGTAENAYGVADNLSTLIPFDTKGKMVYDKDGLPEIN